MRACTRSRAKVFAFVLLFPFAAIAQPLTTAEFTGSAKIGPATRQVAMRFNCALDRGKVNNLAVEMDIPDAEKFKSFFDVIPFEGPGALSGKMHLTAAAASGSAQVDLGSTGSFGTNGAPGTTFTFEASVTPSSKSQLQELRALAATLWQSTSKWSWRIENPIKGRPPIEAIADLTGGDASRLQAAVAGCRAQPR
jgi:hypothetical protein